MSMKLSDADFLIEEMRQDVRIAWERKNLIGWWFGSAALLGFRLGRAILKRRMSR